MFITASTLAAVLTSACPGVAVRIEGDDLVIEGKGSAHRLDVGSSNVGRVAAHYMGFVGGINTRLDDSCVEVAARVARALRDLGIRAHAEAGVDRFRHDVGRVVVTDDVRLVDGRDAHAIERVDERGMFRAHLTRDGVKTVCGLRLGETQKHDAHGGNAMCKRCQALAPRTV